MFLKIERLGNMEINSWKSGFFELHMSTMCLPLGMNSNIKSQQQMPCVKRAIKGQPRVSSL